MKGYWLILSSDVKDGAAQEQYTALWQPVAARFGATIRVLDASVVLRESHMTRRVVVVEFPSVELARECYADPAYQDAIRFALAALDRELLIFEGDLA